MADTIFTASQRMTRSMTIKYNKDNKENNHSDENDTTFTKNDNGKRVCEEIEAGASKRLFQQLNDSPTTTLSNNDSTCNQHSPDNSPSSSLHDQSQLDDNDQTPQKTFSQDSRLNMDGNLTPITDSQQQYFGHSSSPDRSSDGWETTRVSPKHSPPPIEHITRSDGLRYSDLEEDNEDAHYSTFGWPDMDPSSSIRESFLDPIQPSSDPYFSVNDTIPERPLQRTLIQDFLKVDDYVPSDDPLDTNPTDEVDLFFSANQADYHSMSFSTKLSIAQQKEEFLALAKPTYITSWPHFLTYDYFDTHDANDRTDISSANATTDTTGDTTLSSASYFDTKFSVLQRIGSGEYADVWKVWNTESNEVFAVKKLKIPFQSFSDRWLQLVEARHMMMVQDSPYCLTLFNAWEQDGYLYLQTDLAVATLEDYIQHLQDPIEESLAWKVIYEMASGVQAIHHAGLVHLDLKPSNIMIDANGTLKIGDFGTSIRRPMDVHEFKGEGDRHYMAPDLLREEYNSPADVFSLGLVIFELMTRTRLPSTGDSWEMLRLGDFSDYKHCMDALPLEIRRLLLLMLNSSSTSRSTMDDILALPHLQRVASTAEHHTGALYSFVQLMQDD